MCCEYKGTIRIRKSGKAKVICEHDEFFIGKGKTGHALDGDVVLFTKNKDNEYYVVKILEMTKRKYRGKLQINKKNCFFEADGDTLHKDIFIKKEEVFGCENGDLAIVEVYAWHPHEKSPRGHITQLVGDDTYDNQMLSILYENNINIEFSTDVIEETTKINTSIKNKDLKNREDFRSKTTFTIDPEDARDFDDALSIELLDNGNYEVGVHIADVTHYIKKESELDNEAYERAFSTYLVDRVIPMLPEKISNGVCSLNPNEEKLTFSAIFEMTPNGKVIKERIAKTVIISDKRFAYEDAQERIEKNDPELELNEEVNILNKMALKMREDRMKNGSLDFHSKEVKFKIVDNEIEDLFFKESKEANKLIEEFMLLANKSVAKFIFDNDFTCVYRIHDKPVISKLDELKNVSKYLGYDNLENLCVDNSYSKINSFMTYLEDNDHKGIFAKMAIRSMSKAVYSIDNIGHYGLGFEFYTHFTSPIRRYSDMLVHRTLNKILYNKKKKNNVIEESICRHISNKEKDSACAERESIKVTQIHYLKDMIDEEYDAMITRITDFGMYVDILEYDFRGFITYANIKTDKFKSNDEYSATNDNGILIKIGDTINVKLCNVDVKRKQIDFSVE